MKYTASTRCITIHFDSRWTRLRDAARRQPVFYVSAYDGGSLEASARVRTWAEWRADVWRALTT